jgi:PKD repeat protein
MVALSPGRGARVRGHAPAIAGPLSCLRSTVVVSRLVVLAAGLAWLAAATHALADAPPTCRITYAPAAPAAGEVVSFDSHAVDPDGGEVTVTWSFGDYTTGQGVTTSHSYPVSWPYTVTCTVRDAEGLRAACSAVVDMVNQPPICAFTYSTAPAAPSTGYPISFADGSSDPDGAVTSRHWDFGDGATSSVVGPSHQYTAAGAYQVALSVTDNRAGTSTCAQTLEVYDCALELTAEAISPYLWRVTAAVGQCTGGSLEGAPVDWTITDGPGAIVSAEGGDVSDPLAARSYLSAAGETSILIEVHTRGDCTHVKANCPRYLVSAVTALCPAAGPACAISWEPAAVVAGEPVTFEAEIVSGSSAVVAVAWEFGDGGAAGGSPVGHTFANPGVYLVRCICTDATGATGTCEVTAATEGAAAPHVAMWGVRTDAGGYRVHLRKTQADGQPAAGEPVEFTITDGPGAITAVTNGTIWDPQAARAQLDAAGGAQLTVESGSALWTAVSAYLADEGIRRYLLIPWQDPTTGPSCEIAADPAEPLPGELITFSGDPRDRFGYLTAIEWDFGDGSTASGSQVTHSYEAVGDYVVTLTLVDNRGLSAACSSVASVADRTREICVTLAGPAWHLISVPCTPMDPDPTVMFDELLPPRAAYDLLSGRLYRYTGDAYVAYDSFNPSLFGDIRPGDGYWLWLDADTTICYSLVCRGGIQEIVLPVPGWYMIGSPHPADVPFAAVRYRCDGFGSGSFSEGMNACLQDPLVYYDRVLGYRMAGLLPADTDQYLRSGWGYWISTFVPGLTLQIPLR